MAGPTNNTENKPNPRVMEATNRMSQTQLSPLEDTLFRAWANANGIKDPDKDQTGLDLRGLYRQIGGKVMPPNMIQRMGDQSTLENELMKRQQGVQEIGNALNGNSRSSY